MQVDDASANDIMAQLLVLESLDPDRDITMYINSPGGSFTSLMAIYDTMQYVRADIQTVCLGQAASAAAVLLAAGTPGKRLALPNARVLIHQPALSGVIQGQFSDLEIQAAEIERMRTLMETTLAHHTGKDAAQYPQGHRPRQDPDGRGGQGVRDHRHGAGVPQAVGADGLAGARAARLRTGPLATCVRRPHSRQMSRASSAMSSGRTRQHPPMMRAPAAAHCAARGPPTSLPCRSTFGARRPTLRRCWGRR